MRVLLAVSGMARPGGVSSYAADVARALKSVGHDPVVFTGTKGDVSRPLERRGIEVTDDLEAVRLAPDVIHGGRGLETVATMLRFPETPIVCTCHSRVADVSGVLRFPQVRNWIAVDGPCRENLVSGHGVAPERVRWVPNFVDLTRFRPRAPLPERPKRALLFGRFKTSWASMPALLQILDEACTQAGLELDRVGPGLDRVELAPEEVLPAYDLVFARGRSAMEAMAVGAAVVVTSPEGLGPLVTSDDFDRLLRLNFGGMATRPNFDTKRLLREISRYDAGDASAVSARVRKEISREAVVTALEATYEAAIADHGATGPPDPSAIARAASAIVAAAHRREAKQRFRDLGVRRPPSFKDRLRFLLARRGLRRMR